MSQVVDLKKVVSQLEEIHQDGAARSNEKRKKAVKSDNLKTGVRDINFSEGDFVLREMLSRERGKKPFYRGGSRSKWYSVCRTTYSRSSSFCRAGKKKHTEGASISFAIATTASRKS